MPKTHTQQYEQHYYERLRASIGDIRREAQCLDLSGEASGRDVWRAAAAAARRVAEELHELAGHQHEWVGDHCAVCGWNALA